MAQALATIGYAHAAPPQPPAPTQLPTGGQVVAGQAVISQSASATTVTQGTARAAIDWQTFNVGAAATVNFRQPDASSATLNRVLDSNPSQIFGRISAPGQVFFTNPNGMYFAPSASVDVGALVATSHSITNDDFMAGNYRFTRNGATGSVVNDGTLSAGLGGYIALLAPEVRNHGVVVARMGTVAFAAGEAFDLQFDANNALSNIRVEPSTIKVLVENGNAVLAPGGLVILSASAANQVQGSIVSNSGSLNASSMVTRGGRILLTGDNASVAVSGTVDASGLGAGYAGGTIKALGTQVAVKAGANLNASGDGGGGTVLVGGNAHGEGPEANAQDAFVGRAATIRADALTAGNGGKVVVWADNTTQFNGTISARGGAVAGDGGFVETSGKQILKLGSEAKVLTSASHGAMGNWLLDPNTVTIGAQGTENLNGDTFTSPFTPGAGKDDVLGVTTLVNALNGSNIAIAASGGITVAAAIDSSANASAGDLTLSSAGGITLGANVKTKGAQTYSNAVTLSNNVTLDSSAANGAITFGGTVNGANALTVKAGSGAVTFSNTVGATTALTSLNLSGSTGTINLNSTAVNTTGAQTFGGAVVLGASETLTTTNSAVSFNSTIDGGFGLNVAAGSGPVSFGGIVGGTTSLTSLSSSGSGAVALNGDVSTTGSQSYTGAVTLGATGVLTTTNSGVTFGSTINGAYGLTVASGTGQLTLGGIVGGTTALASLSKTGSGQINLNTTAITTTGAQSYGAAVGLGANPAAGTVLTTTNNNVTFSSTVNGAKALTVSAGSGALVLNSTVGVATALSSLDLTGTTGNISLNGSSYRTTGAQTYGGTVSVNNSMTLSTTNSPVTFNKALSSNGTNKSLTITAGTGTVTFNDNVTSSGNKLVGLNLGGTTGTINLNGSAVTTNAGGQTYGGPVVLGSDVAVNSAGGTVAFNSTINGNHNLSVGYSGGTLTFGGVVGGTTPLTSLSVTGTGVTNINNTGITTTGLQNFAGGGSSITLGAATVTLNSSSGNGAITLGKSVNGNSKALVFNTGSGDLSLSGLSGTTSLTLGSPGTLTLNGGTYSTPGASPYTFGAVTTNGTLVLSQDTNFGNLTLGSDTTLNGSTGNRSITLSGKVNSNTGTNYGLTASAGTGAVNFNGAVGDIRAISNLTVTADTASFAGTVAANGGTFTLAPSSAATAMHINDGVSSGLFLSSANLANFSGFGAMVLGSSSAAGGLGVGPTTWNNSVQFKNVGTILATGSQAVSPSAKTIQFSGPVKFSNTSTISTNNGAITFDSAVDALTAGAQALTVSATTAQLTFGGVVGGVAKFSSLDFSGSTGWNYLNGGGVYTTGSQTYGGRVVPGAALVLSSSSGSGTMQFNRDVFGAQPLTVSVGAGTVNFNNTVGTNTPLTSLDLSGSTGPINLGAAATSVITSGLQTWGGTVTGASNTSYLLNGGGIKLNAGASIAASGSGNLTLVTSGTFVNGNASGGLSVGTGRWLVYSQDPVYDTIGNLSYSFKQYNTAYPTAPTPASGNGFLYTLAPTVSVGLTGTLSKTYDGTTTAASLSAANYTLGFGYGGDTVSLISANLPSNATYNTRDVGTGKATTSGALPGIASGTAGSVLSATTNGGAVTVYGYTPASTSASGAIGTITARPVTVTASGNNKTYDGSTSAGATPTLTAGSLVGGDTASWSESYISKNAGTGLTLTPTGTVSDGNGGNNYAVTFVNASSGVINPLAVSLTGNRVYDGTNAANAAIFSVANLVGGDSVSLASGSATLSGKNVGTQTLSSVGTLALGNNTAGNYTLTGASGTVTVSSRPITVTATTNSKTYDGTTAAAASPTISSGSLATGDSVTWSESYAQKTRGTGLTLTPSGVVSDGNGGANYAVTFVNDYTGVIAGRPITVTAVANTKTYDGSTSAAATPVITSGALASGDTATWSETYANKNVGTGLTLSASGVVSDGSGGGNYIITYASASSGAITPKTLTVSGLTASSKVYDGTTAATMNVGAATLTGIVGGDSVALSTSGYTANFADKNVGNAKTVSATGFTITGADVGNYQIGATSATASADITARPITVTASSNTKTYDGSTTATAMPTISSGALASGDSVTWSETYANKTAGTGLSLTPAGVVSDGNSGLNYAVTYVANTTGVINAKTLTVSSLAANSKEYDGNTTATLNASGTTFAGIVGSDVVTLSTSGYTANFNNKNVATGKTVSASGLSLSGGDADNYVLSASSATATASITAKTLTVSGLTASNKVYDGTTTATMNVGAATLTGIVGSESVSLSTTGYTANFDDRNVGTGKTVIASGFTITGADVGNYQIGATSATTTANISARPITVTAATNSKTYDGGTTATATPTITSGTLASGDSATWSESYASKNVGTGLTLTPTGTISDGNSGNNYAVTFASNTTGAIIAKTLTVSGLVANDKVYDGTITATMNVAGATLTGIVGSDSVALNTTGYTATFSDKNVGAGKTVSTSGIVLTGGDAGNYQLSTSTATSTADIIAKTLTVSGLTASNKVYDGTTTATMNVGAATLTGIVGSESVTLSTTGYTANFDDRNVGTGKTVSASGFTITGADVGNYQIGATSATTTANISARPITVTAATNSKTYDGGTTATATPTITSGTLASGDSATWSESYASKNVGTGLTLTPTGTISDGNSGNNYAVTFASNSTGVIAAKTLTVNGLAASDKVYDGTTAATMNLAGAALTGIVGSDSVGLNTTGYTADFADKNVGTAKTVSASGLSLSGADAANYQLGATSATASADITARPITVRAATNSKTYDGGTAAAASPTITSGSLAVGDTAAWSEAYDFKNVGSGLTLRPAGTVNDGNAGLNYAVTFANDTNGVITAKMLTLASLSASNKVYDGTTSATMNVGAASLTGVVGGDSVLLNAAGYTANFDDRNVGVGKTVSASGLSLSGSDAANYQLSGASATASANITARPITVTVAANTKTYDGTAAAAASPTITSGTLMAGDTAAWSESYAAKNVGTGLTLTASGAINDGNGGNNYAVTFANAAMGTITARPITVTAVSNSKTYDGTASATGTPTITSGTLAGGDAASWSETYSGKNVGSGLTLTPTGVVSDGNSGNNYAITFANNSTGTITAKALTVSGLVASDKVYDGTTAATMNVASASLTGIVGGDSVTLSTTGYIANFANKNVGTDIAVAASGLSLSGIDAGNYLLGATSATASASITARPITVVAATDTKTYDGTNTSSVSPTLTSGNLVGGDTVTWVQSFAGKNAGTGLILTPTGVVNDGNGGNNYAVTFTNDNTGVINARAITVSAATSTKTYDGTSSSGVTPTITSGSLAIGDTVSWIQTYDSKNVGSGLTLTPAGSVNDGNSGNNYAVNFVNNTTGVITAKTLTVSGLTASNKVYDGTTTATMNVAGATLSGVIGGDAVAVSTVGYSANFNDRNVGAAKTVAANGFSLSGADAGNYQLGATSATAAADITARPIVVLAATDTKIYDGTNVSAVAPTVTGSLASGDTVTWAQAFAGKNVGSGLTLSPTGLINDGNGGANYAVTFINDNTGVITARPITVVAVSNTKVYDGMNTSLLAPNVTGSLASGDTATWSQSYASKNVGTGLTLTPTGTISDGNGGNNYSVTFTNDSTGGISARPITVAATTNSKTYDGNSASSANPTITSGTLASSDTAIWSQTYASKNAGTGLTLTPTGVVSDGNGGNNYAVTFANNTTGTIVAKTLMLNGITATDKVYDGTTAATMNLAGGTLTGIVGGDAVALNTAAYAANFSDKNVGTAKTVSASGLTLIGSDAMNYQLGASSASANANITSRPITVTAAANSKVYDGTTSSSAAPTLTTGTLAAGDTGNWTESYASKNVGTGLPLTASGAVSDGNGGRNYLVTFVGSSGTITALPITVTAAANAKTYDGTTAASAIPTLSSGSLVSGDTATWSETYASKNAGSNLTLTPAGVVSDGNAGANYIVTFVNGTGSIAAKTLTVSGLTANNKVYDGSATATMNVAGATLTGIVNGDSVAVSTTGYTANFADKNVGVGKKVTASGFTLSGNDVGNYQLGATSAIATADITARPITVMASTNSKTYDGTTTATATPTLTAGTLASGDTASWSQSYASKNAGTGLTLTPTGIVNDGNSGNNYAVTFTTNASGVITARPVTVTATTNSKTYDGTTAAAATPILTSGSLVNGDTAVWSETYASSSPGTGLTLTPTGLVNDGNAGANYAITFAVDNSGVITALPPPPPPPPPPTRSALAIASDSQGGRAVLSNDAIPTSLDITTSNLDKKVADAVTTGVLVNMVRTPTAATDGMVSVSVPKEVASVGTGFTFPLPEDIAALLLPGTLAEVSKLDGTPQFWLTFDANTRMLTTNGVSDRDFPLQVILTIAGKRVSIVISKDAE